MVADMADVWVTSRLAIRQVLYVRACQSDERVFAHHRRRCRRCRCHRRRCHRRRRCRQHHRRRCHYQPPPSPPPPLHLPSPDLPRRRAGKRARAKSFARLSWLVGMALFGLVLSLLFMVVWLFGCSWLFGYMIVVVWMWCSTIDN